MSQQADNEPQKSQSIPVSKISLPDSKRIGDSSTEQSGTSHSTHLIAIHQVNTQSSKHGSSPALARNFSELVHALQGRGWEQLQERFVEEMDERSRVETTLQKAAADLLEIFIIWSQTTVFRDEDRAYKRFKTRMNYVQSSEARLETKRKHYVNVVKAFESALALLRDD